MLIETKTPYHRNGNSLKTYYSLSPPESHSEMAEAVLYLAVCKFEFTCDFRDGHVEKQLKNEKMKPKVRRHHTSKSDEPDLQESAFLKKIIAYQRKLLVQGTFLFHLAGQLYLSTQYFPIQLKTFHSVSVTVG